MSKRSLHIILVCLMFLKILGFFTLSESIAITRLLKIILRLLSTGGVVLLLGMLLNKRKSKVLLFENILSPVAYLFYLILGVCSVFWSTNPSYSILQLFMTSESLFFVVGLLGILQLTRDKESIPGIELSMHLSKSIFALCLVFLIGSFINPDKFMRLTHGGEVARLGGFMMNPNEMGMLSMVGFAALLFQWNYERCWKMMLVFAPVFLYALILTGSRSSLGGGLLIIGLYLLISGNKKIQLAAVIGGFLAFPYVVSNIIVKQGDLQEVLSMTGRIPFWKALLTEGLSQSPYFGFGFMRIAWTDYFSSVHTYAAKMTHNTFIQVLMNLGLVGGVIVLFQMLFTFRNVIISTSRPLQLFFAFIYIPIFINSITEFGIFGESNFGILFYQLLIFLFVVQIVPRRKIERLRAIN